MFIHLHVHTPFSFLDGASSIQALVSRAAALGMTALAITDHNNVSGAVRFQKACQEAGIQPIQGAEVTTSLGHLTLLAQDQRGYANLCRILTQAHLGHPRGQPEADLETLSQYHEGLFALSGCRRGHIASHILHGELGEAQKDARLLRGIFGPSHFFLELEGNLLPGSQSLNQALVDLAAVLGVGVVGTANVHYAEKSDFPVHDILTCARTLTKLADVHPERRLNAQNYLASEKEMARVFARYPEAITNTARIAAQCEPVLTLGRPTFPAFPVPGGETAAAFLHRLVWQGARKRYGTLRPEITQRLQKELDIITTLGYEDYFLLVWDVVRFARARGIRYSGRGSAADSAVAYCLGITEVDAIRRGLLFERFLNLERAEKPDIDVDFDARYRDDVSAYVYQKYGRDHVAAVATYNTFQARSAIRDLGKALDIPAEELDFLARRLPYVGADDIDAAMDRFPELRHSQIPRWKFRRLFDTARAVANFPRHLATHLGGLVISRDPIVNFSPLQMSAKGQVICQFDKDDVEDLGLVKLDLLSLRALSAVDDAVAAIKRQQPAFDYNTIPLDDKATYRMLNRGQTIGVFQLESPAQRALQGRLGAENLEDIIDSVAIIRPGPIKGNMVEPFLARRRGEEPVSYLHPKLKPILEKTYGVVLFQEQVIEIATAIAGFSPGDADRLRRVMTHARSPADMAEIGRYFVQKAVEQGVGEQEASTIFSYIAGYASYGFCEAHAAAFGMTAYKTAYLVRHYPAQFYAAILSNEPMGYYSPDIICNEARRRGVAILPVDINRSEAVFTAEALPAQSGGARYGIRIGLRQVKGMTTHLLKAIPSERQARGPFLSLDDFVRRVEVPRDVLENLIACGAFDSIHPNRRALLWGLPAVLDRAGSTAAGKRDNQPIFPAAAPSSMEIADFSPYERFIKEWEVLGISPGPHFMTFFRRILAGRGIITTREASFQESGAHVQVAGLPVRPHRPPTRSGRTIVYLGLEDESGMLDVTVFEHVYQRYGHVLFGYPLPPLVINGSIEHRGSLAVLLAEAIAPLAV